MEKEQNQQYTKYYICDNCDFKCSKKSNYEKHLLTSKHQKGILLNKKTQKPIKNAIDNFICKKCNKEYKARNSLWYHEKNVMLNFYIKKRMNQ